MTFSCFLGIIFFKNLLTVKNLSSMMVGIIVWKWEPSYILPDKKYASWGFLVISVELLDKSE